MCQLRSTRGPGGGGAGIPRIPGLSAGGDCPFGAGTAGCCGALVLLFGCLCCGLCEREFTDTYRHHTLCGRWCPV